MIVTPLRQTRRHNCGQTAVAMLTGKTITEVEGIYGHKSTTYTTEHIRAVKKLGYYPDDRGFQKMKPGMALPEVALVRVCYLKRSGGRLSTSGKVRRTGHLVLYVNGNFFDPAGMIYSLKSMPVGIVVDQFLEVLVP